MHFSEKTDEVVPHPPNERHYMKLLSNRGGINRIVAVLLALIAVMLVVIAIPAWEAYRERAQVLACEQALNSARDGLIIDFLSRGQAGTVQSAMATLDEVMPERANLCPSGGTVYLVRDARGIFEPICGLHDPDAKQRARLNASRALDLLKEDLRKERRASGGEPEAVEIQLNGQPLSCVRVQKEEPLRRGTRTTNGYDGVVAFYGLAGEGDFSADEARQGAICYFIYADEDYCVVWREEEGWTGTAYQ